MRTATSIEHAMRLDGVDAYEAARMMKEAGFDGVDLAMCHEQLNPEFMKTEEWAKVLYEQYDAIKAAGMTVEQCHLPYYPGHLALPGDGSYEAFEEFALGGLIHGIEVAGKIGCPVAVLHPFLDVNNDEATLQGNIRLINALLPHLKKNNVKLALENVYAHDGQHYHASVTARAEDIMKILEQVDEEYVGACIDTGHARIFRLNIGKMARLYGKRLFALHVNSNAGEDEHLIPYLIPAWCEKVNYEDFLAALKEIGYQGAMNLEIGTGKMPAGCAKHYLGLAGVVARAMANA